MRPNTKNIPYEERLIVALDVPSVDEAKRFVEALGDSVLFYKVGLQLNMSPHFFDLIDWLVCKGKKVFVDLKFLDIPQTVKLAVQNLADTGAIFTTIHAGNKAILEAAVSVKKNLHILAVTVLTSIDEKDKMQLGISQDTSLKELVMSRAQDAIASGCDGVISSALEAPDLRATCGNDFIIVCPGIRPFKQEDDQKRTADIEEAFSNGADYIVVGRPIRQHHGFHSPQLAAESIQQRIRGIFT